MAVTESEFFRSERDKVVPGDRIEYVDSAPEFLRGPLWKPEFGTVVDVVNGAAGLAQVVISCPDQRPEGLRVDFHVPGLVEQDAIRKVRD